MAQGIDKRILRSRRALLRALPTILAEKPLERVTVLEVAKAAGINRKTFYAHYTTPKDLHDDLAHEIHIGVIRRMGGRTPARPADLVASVASLARDYREEFQLFLTAPNLHDLRRMVLTNLAGSLSQLFFPNDPRGELRAAAVIGSTLALYTTNFLSASPLSLPALEELHLEHLNCTFAAYGI